MPIPANLEAILNNGIVESVRVECKEGWNPEPILHTICAFANDIDNFYGGYVLLGIDDKGNVKGFDKRNFDCVQKDIVSFCKKCIQPSYVPVIDIMPFKNKNIVVIWCPAGNERPYKCLENVYLRKNDVKKYAVYIRKGSLTIHASRNDEYELQYLFSHEPFDDRINYHYSIDVIKQNLVEQYLKETRSNLLINFYNRPFKETLMDLKLIDGPNEDYHPKNVALLMFTDKPKNYIPYSYIELTVFNDDKGISFKEKIFDDCLPKQYDDCLNYLKSNVIESKTYKLGDDYKSKTVYNYSFSVLEEVIANAILHKSYQISEPVTIRVEPYQIVVTNVPGFDRTISNTAIKELKPKSKRYQYRRLADFLKELHIVEAKNTGYPLIVNKSNENESPLPIIDMNEERDYVSVIIPINKAFDNNNLSLRDKIINALTEKAMSKTELCHYLGYKRVVNSVTYQLQCLLNENKIKVNNKKFSLI